MRYSSTTPEARQAGFARWSTLFLVLLAAMLFSGTAYSQEITGSIRGTVVDPTGAAITNQSVTITDTRTGSTRQVTTNDSGTFTARGLAVGGPFSIRVDNSDFTNALVTDVFTSLGGTASVAIALEASDGTLDEIVVLGSTIATQEVAIGPSSTFDFAQIEALPTISRQIRDIVRLDPRVSVGRANGGNGFGISCLGGSGRSNSFTIDGVRNADGFGLNASGNSARNTFPIPFDSVGSAAVEFAPIDVQYGAFTGCNINVVTQSGTNDFVGSVFYLSNDDSLTGTDLEDDIVLTEPFDDTNWGFDIGGPIIKDKLFFYVAYEETDEGGTQNDGPIGAGFANEGDLTIEDANRIANILATSYDRDVGELIRNLPQTSERVFARIDWNINDQHRLEATLTSLEESNLEPDDFGFNGFTFGDNFEQEGTEQDAYSVRLFSNWSDVFSTEFRYSTLDVIDIQGPLGGGEAQNENFPRIQVQDGNGNNILLSGPGFFRSANDLQYTLDQIKFAGDYVVGAHTITAGYELDSLDVFNLFIPNATGTITFASIDDLEAGIASGINGLGSFTGDPTDAAASFQRDIHTFYIQDEWQLNERMIFTAGLRYDNYASDDAPIENPIYEERYGFTNTQSFDGLDIIMPRLGLTYDLPFDSFGEMQMRAGFGVFTGGDPTVHFANAFQNFGGAIGFGANFTAPCTAGDLQVLQGGQFTGIPDCVGEAQRAEAAQNTGRADAVDPNFELPSQNRFNIGLSWYTDVGVDFFNDWDVQVDYIYSDIKNAAEFLDLTLTQNVDATGAPIFLPDGRPQFVAVDPLLAGCNATFAGPGLGFNGVTPECFAGGDDQDILLTNGPSGETTSISLQLGKEFAITDRTSIDINFGYAYTDSEIGNPINSSTATSGFEEVATAVINSNTLAPSQYANKHNIVLATTFKHYFFENHATSATVFFRRRSGRPISYAYDNNTPTGVFGDSDNEERNLFYVPTGPNDPLVDLSALDAQGTTDAFFDYLDSTGLSAYAGQVSPRNGFEQAWSTDMDIRIQQDIPLPSTGFEHSLRFFFDIENFLNLLSDDRNIQRFADNGDVSEAIPVLDAALSADGSQYVYSNFAPGGSRRSDFLASDRDVDDSVWRVQLGFRYNFGR
ncbi:MAG: TonB-dependent receptor [Pseudomonadota bacterium]